MKGGTSSQPRAWPSVQLGDVAELCLGKMLDANKNKGRLLPYVRNPDVRWFDVDVSNLRLMPFEEREDERFGLKPGDVLVCEGGDAGRAAIWRGQLENVKFQKAIHRVRVGPRLENRFLVHRLLADHQSGQLADYFTGATIKHLTGQDLARYSFALPPLAEQRRIADILDRADAMRAKRREAIALLESLSHAVFEDMFGRDGDGKWAVRPVSDWVQKFETGKSVDPDEEGTPTRNRVLKVSAVTSLEFLPDESKPVPDEYEPPADHFVRPGDLLFSRANTRELIGATAMVGDVAANLLLPDKLWRFVWREPRRVEPLFVQALFRTTTVRQTIGQRASGTSGSMKNISQDKVLEMEAMLPPLELQQEFARRVAAIDKLKAAHRNSLAEMDALFASLQHRAFRGEL